jgi:Amt family ammonium transporter
MSIALPNIPVFNASIPDGGNPLEVDVNAPYLNLEFHMVYQLIMGGLVFLIIPGIGLLYGGMARRKSSLAMIFQSMTIMSLCTVQWMFWGYSLSFSRTGHGHFIGDMSNFVLWNVHLPSNPQDNVR